MSGGWFPDPSGRFGQRWYDGAAWTDHVVAANGRVIDDRLPTSEAPYPPPKAGPRQPPVAPPLGPPPRSAPPPGPGPGAPPLPLRPPGQHIGSGAPQPAGPMPATRVRYAPGVGLALGIAGIVVVALSLFVLKWADADKGGFLDLSKAARDAGGDGADQVVYTYAAYGGFVVFALAAVWVLLAGMPIPGTQGGNTYQRIVGTLICGGAAIYQAVAITHLFRGPASPEIGAWLGVGGYFVIVAGMIVGARRVVV